MSDIILDQISNAFDNVHIVLDTFHAFLDNPKMVQQFNDHTESIVAKHQHFILMKSIRDGNISYTRKLQNNHAMAQVLYIHPDRIDAYKRIALNLTITNHTTQGIAQVQAHNGSITVSHHILEWPDHLQRTALAHELGHTIQYQNVEQYDAENTDASYDIYRDLVGEKPTNYAHASELWADAFGNYISPQRHKSELMEQLDITAKLLYVDQMLEEHLLQNPNANRKKIIQESHDRFKPDHPDIAWKTHPSMNTRIENTRVVLAQLATFNDNAAMGNKPAAYAATPHNKLTT